MGFFMMSMRSNDMFITGVQRLIIVSRDADKIGLTIHQAA